MLVVESNYNSDLLKGTGLIQETLLLLDIYQAGISKGDLINKAIESNILVKNHNNRIKDIVSRVFYRRYFSFGEEVVLNLKQLRANHISLEVLSQILFIYTCRNNSILFDFITDVYHPLRNSDKRILPDDAALNFINDAIKNGIIKTPWSESTKLRVARHIIATITDFKLIDNNKNILELYLYDFTVNYLAHELHFNGLTEQGILEANEWKLFGYIKIDTIKHLERISFQGHFIFQNSGEIIKINWSYENMKEFINAVRQ